MSFHQYNMGIVGNCAYLAYIDQHAAVQWMCMPRFDSSFVFGGLLDKKRGGEFYIQPEGLYATRQYYIPNTNVLCTEFECARGRFRVIDCAPRFFQYERNFKPLMLVRKIELLEGNPLIQVVCHPVTDYGKTPSHSVPASNHIRYDNFSHEVRLTTDVPLSYILEQNSFVLNQNRYLVFTYGEALEAPLKATAEDFINKTVRYWRTWIKSTYIPDIYQNEVIRSALVLKLHQYEDTGGIIASGTTSLPEHHGSARTWDYRYCWFRDAYYTLKAFNEIGHFDELERYFDYIQNVLVNEEFRVQPLYSITGERTLDEYHLDLEGYLGNQPVRIGNKAFEQIQNDVYGQVLVSLLPLFTDRRLTVDKTVDYRALVSRLLRAIERTLDEKDAGLWEFRNVRQTHTYTLLFHWAGSQAAWRMGVILNDQAIQEKARQLVAASAGLIERCYDPEQQVYRQALESQNVDASTLKLITMNYLDPSSERARVHLKHLEAALRTEQGLVYRYVHPDDFGKPEATFLVCTFWYIDALACTGRVDDAERALNNVLQYANHLGIFSEDVGLDGSQWGNFPQTYSHVGLINAVCRIAKKKDIPTFKMT
jgi:GH15 family glucan-1,4-alpha-glucosidase